MPTTLSVAESCGQLLVAGFPGNELPGALVDMLRARSLGGVILFKRNVPDVSATYALCRQVLEHSSRELPPFISIDQEGGRVFRLPSPVLRLPPMRVLGDTGDPSLARLAGALTGQQLGALGINLNFAPVLDVDTNPDNPIIGDRSFGRDADTVARMGRAYIEGLQSEGVMGCGKHFPGHGDTDKDSHLDLPVVSHDKQRLDAVELPPFRTASLRGVAALMTAHVLYPALDPGVPATLSHRICTTLLRTEIGFSGVLFSDDLEMRALSDRMDIEQSAVLAVRAGCDALLVCSDLDLLQRAHRALVVKAEADAEFRTRVLQATTRSLAARRRFPPRPVSAERELAPILGDPAASAFLESLQQRVS